MFEEVLIIQDGKLALQEDADVLRNSACAVSGTEELVENFIQDKEVIMTKKLAGMMTAYVVGHSEGCDSSWIIS